MRLVALAFAALAGVGFGGSSPAHTYRDVGFGFVVTVPHSFGVAPFDYVDRATVAGAAFGRNVPHPNWFARFPELRVPDRGVVLLVEHIAGGPPLQLPVSGHDTKLPLSRASFSLDYPGSRGLYAFFVGNGWKISARVRIGAHASAADRQALWKMARSIRMRPLRPGETVGEAPYVVAEQADSYPVGSVTRVGHAFLVHAPHGFYALAQANRSCELTFTLPVAFSCPDGRHWDRVGRPIWANASPIDALSFAPTNVTADGYVLVAEHSLESANADNVERQLWG